ncbi:flavoredoxin [Candidatus Poribacteria bacterium]|nr:flavoredoxin [Candidatus Poribacteria bacterium]
MSTIPQKIPDDALVVRGGQNRPEDIRRGTGTHPSGVTGVSVESMAGVSVAELAKSIPHGQVGVTTVGEVRKAGGDVIRTSGRTPYHATLTGLTPEQASKLLTPTMPNPTREERK